MTPSTPTNMRPTMELRYFRNGKFSPILQQKWINDDATVSEWRPVPTVTTP